MNISFHLKNKLTANEQTLVQERKIERKKERKKERKEERKNEMKVVQWQYIRFGGLENKVVALL